ncbi:NIPSNAP family protein [Pedobacter westerhofensis]
MDTSTVKELTAESWFELRIYSFKSEEQQALIEDFYSLAIPVLNTLGVNPVGVFNDLELSLPGKLYVLLPYHSPEHLSEVSTAMDNDTVFQESAIAYLNAPANAPAYERIESSFMKGLKNFPHLMAPADKKAIFELRQYQSASEAAGKKKIEMFNDQGEIDIFKRLQFDPVFWGETIIGPDRPNLTYMVSFDSLSDKDTKWSDFLEDAEWKAISAAPEYANELLVSLITSTLLISAECSQI